jgi:hypothetical protein
MITSNGYIEFDFMKKFEFMEFIKLTYFIDRHNFIKPICSKEST